MFLAGIVARGMKEFYYSIREDALEDENCSIDSKYTDTTPKIDKMTSLCFDENIPKHEKIKKRELKYLSKSSKLSEYLKYGL